MRLFRFTRYRLIFLGAVAACAVAVLALRLVLSAPVRPPDESIATAAAVKPAGPGAVSVPKDALAWTEGGKRAYVMRLENLRARRVEVHPATPGGDVVTVSSEGLAAGDFVLKDPGSFWDGEPVAVGSGIDDRMLVALTLHAGIAAAEREDLSESARFISPRYSDSLGFDFGLWTGVLARANKEFDRPKIEILDGLHVEIDGRQAVVRGTIRVSALYGGRRGWLLGGPESSNAVLARMEKSGGAWKLVEIRGLMPLGFDEKSMKLLGAEVGLPLTGREKVEKKEFCMPCRGTMSERFGH